MTSIQKPIFLTMKGELLNSIVKYLILILTIVLSTICTYGQTLKIHQLEITDTSIFSPLKYILREEIYDNNSGRFFHIFLKKDSTLQIRILLDNNIETLFSYNKIRKVKGYFLFQDIPTFVYGDLTDIIFKKLSCSKRFSQNKKKINTKNLFVAPTIHDPVIYIYQFKNNKLIFKELGFNDLFKD